MLKIEQLNMLPGLNADEKYTPAIAKIMYDDTTLAAGTCEFHPDGGMNVLACITAGGKVGSAVTATLANIKTDGKLKVVLEKTVTRELVVEEGETTVNLGIAKADLVAVKVNGETVSMSDITAEGVATVLADAAAKDTAVTAELTVTSSTAFVDADNNLNSGLKIDAGPIHFSIIAEAEHHHGSKHAITHCEVRGRNPWNKMGEDAPIHV